MGAKARKGSGAPKRRDSRQLYDKFFAVKLTASQAQRIDALTERTPRAMNKSDVFRALIEMALPAAEARPAVLWELPEPKPEEKRESA